MIHPLGIVVQIHQQVHHMEYLLSEDGFSQEKDKVQPTMIIPMLLNSVTPVKSVIWKMSARLKHQLPYLTTKVPTTVRMEKSTSLREEMINYHQMWLNLSTSVFFTGPGSILYYLMLF